MLKQTKTPSHDYQFKIDQIKAQLTVINALNALEIKDIANTVKKNLEVNTRTLIAITPSDLLLFQLDMGLPFTKKIEQAFKEASSIYLAKENRHDTFKADISAITFKKAKNKSMELKLPATKSIVRNLIQSQIGKVAVNKYNISQIKKEFQEKGNHIMSSFIEKAIINHEF